MAPLLSSRLRWHFLGRSGSLPFVLEKLTRGHPVGTRWMRKYARVYVWPCVYECLNFSISVKRTLFLISTLLFPARTLHTNHSGPFRKSKMSHKSLARGSVCRAFSLLHFLIMGQQRGEGGEEAKEAGKQMNVNFYFQSLRPKLIFWLLHKRCLLHGVCVCEEQ